MNVVGICGASGVGKTTLIEQLIAQLKARGLRVSVIKHAHHAFDIDTPGKDTWRHREAGAFEVLIASGQRLAKMREYEVEGHPSVHQLLAELLDCDWVLVEGYKHADIPKVEVWRAAVGQAPVYPDEPFVVAVATDEPQALPVPTTRPVFDMARPEALASFLVDTADRFHYRPEIHG